jgi:chromosome segregation ATPase
MKTLVTVILILACGGLVIALVATQKHIDAQRQDYLDKIMDYSNQVVAANDELTDLREVNLMLTNEVNTGREQILALSNQVLAVSGSLSNSDLELKSAQDQITALQAQNEVLDQQAAELTNTIADLNTKILEARNKLAVSETNKTFLEGELTNEVARYAELQREFTDLKTVRQQARKLHNELVMERRLQWIREGTAPGANTHGASLLMARAWPTNQLTPPTHYNLSVEVDSSGAVRIVSDTNTPAANP